MRTVMLPVKFDTLKQQISIFSSNTLAKNSSVLACSFLLTIGLLSCSKLPQSTLNSINLNFGVNVTDIGDIKLDPKSSPIFYLRGLVIRQVPLIDWQMYQLQDKTGKIWVVTNKNTLQLQDQVLIKGKIHYAPIFLEGKDLGEMYVEEQEQIERISAR